MDEHSKPSQPFFRPIWLGYLGLLGLLSYLHPILSPTRFFFVCSLLYLGWLGVSVVRYLLQPPSEAENSQHVPLPGPAQQRGMAWFWRNYMLSTILAHLNPRLLWQMICQIVGQIRTERQRGADLPFPDTWQSNITYRLPFEGEWYVYNGGITPDNSHSWDLISQRYAYDFVMVDQHKQRHPPQQGDQPEHYYVYHQHVLAPADGVVVELRDGVRDAPQVGTGWIDWLTADIRGNYLVIRHAEQEYSLLAHLVPGSLLVTVGAQVKAGQPIARCGHSGFSSEPHLHFQVQDRANFYTAAGVPIRWQQLIVDGHYMKSAYLQAGQRVSPGGTAGAD